MKLLFFFFFFLLIFILTPPHSHAQELDGLLTLSDFNRMLPHRDDRNCLASGFYTYRAFIAAAESFPGFGTTGDVTARKRELAAFFGQTSHETTGGWPSAPDGPYAWGYCFHREQGSPPDYCVPSAMWPCASGEKYYGRGPMQISYNYNYGAAGRAIGVDLLSNPDLVATDPVISFKTAIWFWMTPQSPKPSPHDVIVGRWQPENRSDRYLALDVSVTISLKKASWLRMTPQSSRPSSSSDDVIIGRWQPADRDVEAGEIAGYGVITDIIDGGVECGKGTVESAASRDRIGYYKRYCDILGVSYGDNLDCKNQNLFSR